MDPESAFTFAYGETDRRYLLHAREQAATVVGRPTELFAGTCAVGTYIDFGSGTIHIGNLGDSRAVFGVTSAYGASADAIPLSWDHACEHKDERTRLCSEHPAERPYDVIINCGGDDGYPDDYRVKGVCSFTRSIGDFQMKDKDAAATYNSHTQGYKVVPRPGVVPAGQASINKPYIINEPTFATQVSSRTMRPVLVCADACHFQSCNNIHDGWVGLCSQAIQDGFLIVACDGVWDELSNEQAVRIVDKVTSDSPFTATRHAVFHSRPAMPMRADPPRLSAQLLKEHPEPDAPIAELFIDQVLKYAVKRIKSEIPEEKHITLEKMKARPVGKADYTCRSCLHDDITAFIVQFSGVGNLGVQVPEAETPLSAHSGLGGGSDDALLKAENAELRTQVAQLQQRVQQLELELTEAKQTAASGGAASSGVDVGDEFSDV